MNEEKYKRIIDLIESLHKEVLYTFLHREISLEISRLTYKSSKFDSFYRPNFEDSTSVKKYLFELIVNLRKKYEKVLKLKENVRDIYEEIIEEINKEFPVFPHDFTEFLFEKTMNKAFKEDKIKITNNNYHYTHQLINKVVNNKKTYKYP
jgi:hypothetical protein